MQWEAPNREIFNGYRTRSRVSFLILVVLVMAGIYPLISLYCDGERARQNRQRNAYLGTRAVTGPNTRFPPSVPRVLPTIPRRQDDVVLPSSSQPANISSNPPVAEEENIPLTPPPPYASLTV